MEFLILRWAHLVFGSFWAGTGIAMGWFVIPALQGAGPAAGAVMQGLVARRFPQIMMVSGLITVLAGARMYMLVYSPAWIATTPGILITCGAVTGIAVMVVGTALQGRNSAAMGKLAAAIAAVGGPPTAEQQAAMGTIQARMRSTASGMAWLFAITFALMAGARVFA